MLFSIITVSYNSEKTIKKTIESVLHQSFFDFEYIVIDGGSTDGTIEIVKSYEKKFSDKGISYTWISEKDRGIYDAMNKGAGLAKGVLIGMLNSDDWYEAKTLQLVADEYKISKAEYIHGNIHTFSPSYDFLKLKKPESKEKMVQRMTFFHPASFISKKIYEDLGGYSLDYEICSDYDFILKLIRKNYRIK
jgi:glycosyltransferase involved in cell wall biosynthesis